jgi:hypothetical protein
VTKLLDKQFLPPVASRILLAGLLLAQLLPQKPRQQNLRCTSKISDMPAEFIYTMND